MPVLRSLARGALGLLLTTIAFDLPAQASETVPQSTPMLIRGEAPMPEGYLILCQSTPRVCNFGGSHGKRTAANVAKMTPMRFAQLQSVTMQVNRRMRQVEDRTRFGVADRWTVGGGAGDCEDFAMTKRTMLMSEGWPSSAVLVALVTYHGEEHAVLVARTDAGDFVLDNLNSSVKPWRDTSYTWNKIQGPNEFGWRSL
jgi:predicted transglutaminase-like cysteine proteinase